MFTRDMYVQVDGPLISSEKLWQILAVVLIILSPEDFVAVVFVIPSSQSGYLLFCEKLLTVAYITSASSRHMTSRKFPVNLI